MYSHFSIIQYYSNMWEPYLESVFLNDGGISGSPVKLCERTYTPALLPSESNSKGCALESAVLKVSQVILIQPWLMVSCHRLKCLGSWVGHLN